MKYKTYISSIFPLHIHQPKTAYAIAEGLGGDVLLESDMCKRVSGGGLLVRYALHGYVTSTFQCPP